MSNELKHHGVLGMKWGVRNDRRASRIRKKTKKQSKSATSEPQKIELSEDYINKLRVKNKPLASLSNKELREFNDRMNLEKTYAQLTAKSKSKYKEIAMRILGSSLEKTATKYVSAYMDKGVAALIGETPTKNEKEKVKK